MKSKLFGTAAFVLFIMALTSCGSDDPVVVEDGYEVRAVVDTVLIHDTIIGDSNMLIRYECPDNVCAHITTDYSYSADSDTIFMDVTLNVEDSSCSSPSESGLRERTLTLEYNVIGKYGDIVLAYYGEGGERVCLNIYAYPPSSLSNVIMDPPSPQVLQFSDLVTISFDYTTPVPGGVRVWLYTRHHETCGSPLYEDASGSGTSCFTFHRRDYPIDIDEVGIYMYSEQFDREILRVSVPAEYRFQEW